MYGHEKQDLFQEPQLHIRFLQFYEIQYLQKQLNRKCIVVKRLDLSFAGLNQFVTLQDCFSQEKLEILQNSLTLFFFWQNPSYRQENWLLSARLFFFFFCV